MTSSKTHFWHPSYWPTHFGFLILTLVAHLPAKVRRSLGRLLGGLMLKLAGRRERIARTNISRCFPELSSDKLDERLQLNFKATGQGLIETASCWHSNLSNQKKNSNVVGKEHLDEALAKGKGVILLSFHLTTLEMGGCLLGEHYDFFAMYKPNTNPLLEKAMCDGRLRHLHGLLDRNDLRGTIRALKANKIVWFAPDQNYGGKTSIFVPFFDIQTNTITSTTKLAKLTGASVVPFTQRRLNDADCYELTIHPAFQDFPSGSEYEDTSRINQFLEDYLRQYPDDYMWLHQRFRDRPQGEAPFYTHST